MKGIWFNPGVLVGFFVTAKLATISAALTGASTFSTYDSLFKGVESYELETVSCGELLDFV